MCIAEEDSKVRNAEIILVHVFGTRRGSFSLLLVTYLKLCVRANVSLEISGMHRFVSPAAKKLRTKTVLAAFVRIATYLLFCPFGARKFSCSLCFLR